MTKTAAFKKCRPLEATSTASTWGPRWAWPVSNIKPLGWRPLIWPLNWCTTDKAKFTGKGCRPKDKNTSATLMTETEVWRRSWWARPSLNWGMTPILAFWSRWWPEAGIILICGCGWSIMAALWRSWRFDSRDLALLTLTMQSSGM